jgi:hypothetical protein
MLGMLLRASAEVGPVATSVALIFSLVITVLLVYVGIAMRAVLRASDPKEREIRYQMFRDLLDVFRRGKGK